MHVINLRGGIFVIATSFSRTFQDSLGCLGLFWDIHSEGDYLAVFPHLKHPLSMALD